MITTHNLDGSFGELELVFLSSSSHEASPVNHENVLQTLFRLVNEESCTCTIVMMTKSACWSELSDDNLHSLDSISDKILINFDIVK